MYRKLTTFVVSAHLVAILFLLFSPAKKIKIPHKHITVRTVQSKTPPMTIISNSPKKGGVSSKPAAPSKSVKTTAPAQKSAPVSKKTAVVEKNKSAQPSKPKTTPQPQAWKEIDEALAKIDEKMYSSSKSKLDVPQMAVAAPFELPSLSFEDEGSPEAGLVGFLHSSLNLPEFGEVTIQLTVKRDGSVARLVVIKAESQKNRAYLEQHLPLLKFPVIVDNEKTFTLTFCNEI